MTKEEIYDAEIAPKLREVAELCRKHGFPITTVVEWSPEDWGTTNVLLPLGPTGLLTRSAVEASGNFDLLAIRLLCEHGPGASLVLRAVSGREARS